MDYCFSKREPFGRRLDFKTHEPFVIPFLLGTIMIFQHFRFARSGGSAGTPFLYASSKTALAMPGIGMPCLLEVGLISAPVATASTRCSLPERICFNI